MVPHTARNLEHLFLVSDLNKHRIGAGLLECNSTGGRSTAALRAIGMRR